MEIMEKFTPLEILHTNRLALAKRTHQSDDEMWKAIEENRQFLREYLFWVDGTQNLSDVFQATDTFMKNWEDNTGWSYCLYRACDNRFIGCIGVHNISFKNQSAELGYWLRQDETGNGYMKEAIQALEQELFAKGFHRLTILCDENNKASAQTAVRAGYALESIAKESLFHYTGLHACMVFVKFSPYPIRGL